MGRMIKSHWARLLTITAAVWQIVASIEGFIWPKIFWDFSTSSLNPLVRPSRALQTLNLVLGLLTIAWEWPVPLISTSPLHRSIIARIVFYPLCAFFALLMYQSTTAGICYLFAMAIYFWALREGEVSTLHPRHGFMATYNRHRSYVPTHGTFRN